MTIFQPSFSIAKSIARNVGWFRSWSATSFRRNQRERKNPPEAPNARPRMAEQTPNGNPKTAAVPMMKGLAGIKGTSDPTASRIASASAPNGPKPPIHVQIACKAGTTGKNKDATASAINRTTAIESFLVSEDTPATYETMSLERNTSCSRYPLTIRGAALPTIFEPAYFTICEFTNRVSSNMSTSFLPLKTASRSAFAVIILLFCRL